MADDAQPQSGSASPIKALGDEIKANNANLSDLISQATLQYSLKNREEAAELYARATELQAEQNGEMCPANADLLYAYGRCLYHLAVDKSDVLGSKVAGEKANVKRVGPEITALDEQVTQTNGKPSTNLSNVDAVHADEARKAVNETKEGVQKAGGPYFQFHGDENFDNSEEEDDEEAEKVSEDDADEEDDFANAYEVLDMARILLIRQLEDLEASKGKPPERTRSSSLPGLQERLADTFDLQAEISLEGERFSEAVNDLKSALGLKARLFPPQSSLLAEAHYKLSLALEFASMTRQHTERGESNSDTTMEINHTMRAEAAKEMEAAISSCRLRISIEEAATRTENQGTEQAVGSADSKHIADVKEMVVEMEQRLAELLRPPLSLNDAEDLVTKTGKDPVAGVASFLAGESIGSMGAKPEEVAKTPNDLTKFVKRKRPANDETLAPPESSPSSMYNKEAATPDVARSHKKAKG